MIDRPRLRSLLDELTANVRLIIGPPGYGKTTLARQWIAHSEVQAAWYQCTEASADVAALAVGIARASESIFPEAGKLLESRFRAATSDTTDVTALVELITTRSESSDAVLVIDDYHELLRSGPAEQLVAELVESRSIRLLICSRRRPSWATARRLLYGEIEEVNREDLAMTPDEVRAILGGESVDDAFMEAVGGWPAVVGLASRSRTPPLKSSHRFPSELYEFFAEELYQALPERLRSDLHRLVILPSAALDYARHLFGDRWDSVVTELSRMGFLTSNDHAQATGGPAFDLHPLLREFVKEKLMTEARPLIEHEATQIVASLIEHARWDDAFAVIRAFGLWSLLPELLESSLSPLLDQGRLTTVDEWLLAAQAARLKEPLLDLAHAELLLRRGAWIQAVSLASDAANSLGVGHPLRSRALNCAARAAHFSDRSDLATDLHRQALEAARGPEDVRQALWGKFICENSIDRVDDARGSLETYERLEVVDRDDLVRGCLDVLSSRPDMDLFNRS